jgi:hypothetical protein
VPQTPVERSDQNEKDEIDGRVEEQESLYVGVNDLGCDEIHFDSRVAVNRNRSAGSATSRERF